MMRLEYAYCYLNGFCYGREKKVYCDEPNFMSSYVVLRWTMRYWQKSILEFWETIVLLNLFLTLLLYLMLAILNIICATFLLMRTKTWTEIQVAKSVTLKPKKKSN